MFRWKSHVMDIFEFGVTLLIWNSWCTFWMFIRFHAVSGGVQRNRCKVWWVVVCFIYGLVIVTFTQSRCTCVATHSLDTKSLEQLIQIHRLCWFFLRIDNPWAVGLRRLRRLPHRFPLLHFGHHGLVLLELENVCRATTVLFFWFEIPQWIWKIILLGFQNICLAQWILKRLVIYWIIMHVEKVCIRRIYLLVFWAIWSRGFSNTELIGIIFTLLFCRIERYSPSVDIYWVSHIYLFKRELQRIKWLTHHISFWFERSVRIVAVVTMLEILILTMRRIILRVILLLTSASAL